MIPDVDAVDDPARRLALECVLAGIEAAEPATVVAERVSLDGTALVVGGERYDLDDYDEVIVVGGGNAAATAASALEGVLGDRLDRGAVVTDNPVETDRVEVLPGDHPVPSERGVRSTRKLLDIAESAGPDDLVIGIITGGGSALMPAPAEGIDLAALQATTEGLLASGATIGEINAVRKHCSDLKGGQLAGAASPATVVGLVFSDVVGNRLDVVASGPLTPDESTYADALDVLDRYDVDVPEAVETRLRRGDEGEYPETPGPDDEAVAAVSQHVLADGTTALEGAAEAAREAGYEPLVLSSRIRGEAREAAKVLAGVAEECAATGTPVEPPAVLLSGGETTVTIRGDGVGGPNQEFALSAAVELADPDVVAASADTDGIDGNSDAAGGIATRGTADPVDEARAALANNDAGSFLERRDGLIVTGPTGTNVNDLRVFVVPER
ncbi:glycerate kinase type-2 family protein [Halorussus sp. AFM4]|uniref:glycerate kinase type-2 family protein n=1 Tax=Halorussus sp. AFM4 TaxID=3421651 RepID=UPI003EBC06C6